MIHLFSIFDIYIVCLFYIRILKQNRRTVGIRNAHHAVKRNEHKSYMESVFITKDITRYIQSDGQVLQYAEYGAPGNKCNDKVNKIHVLFLEK